MSLLFIAINKIIHLLLLIIFNLIEVNKPNSNNVKILHYKLFDHLLDVRISFFNNKYKLIIYYLKLL